MIVIVCILTIAWVELVLSCQTRLRSTAERAYDRQQTRREKLSAYHWNNSPMYRD